MSTGGSILMDVEVEAIKFSLKTGRYVPRGVDFTVYLSPAAYPTVQTSRQKLLPYIIRTC